MKVFSKTVALKSKYPFKIAYGTRLYTETYLVKIEKDGLTGYGEATPVPYYGIKPSDLDDLLRDNLDFIEAIDWQHPRELWEALSERIDNTFLLCAIDIAAYDIWSKKIEMPLHKALGLELNHEIKSNYTIGIDEIPVMVQKMQEFDFPIYKIKLGTNHDYEIVKELRKHTNAIFRIDANGAWNENETIENCRKFKNLGVEFIEQPLQADNYEGMKSIIELAELPIIADESCKTYPDLHKCENLFNGINIKLAKCGGITPALKMIEVARSKGLKVMLGCMTETSIGISAIAHLCPLLDYVDMDGALLVANDPAVGIYIENGNIIYNQKAGIGVEIDW
jgi:L-Ala-D/L-Glu epimerase